MYKPQGLVQLVPRELRGGLRYVAKKISHSLSHFFTTLWMFCRSSPPCSGAHPAPRGGGGCCGAWGGSSPSPADSYGLYLAGEVSAVLAVHVAGVRIDARPEDGGFLSASGAVHPQRGAALREDGHRHELA